jgi:hypothetical protein
MHVGKHDIRGFCSTRKNILEGIKMTSAALKIVQNLGPDVTTVKISWCTLFKSIFLKGLGNDFTHCRAAHQPSWLDTRTAT